MTNEPHESNNDVQYLTAEHEYINCIGRDCNNVAKYTIKLAIVKRSGYFCDNCRNYFEERGLVVSCSTIDLGVGKGEFVKSSADEKRTIE